MTTKMFFFNGRHKQTNQVHVCTNCKGYFWGMNDLVRHLRKDND